MSIMNDISNKTIMIIPSISPALWLVKFEIYQKISGYALGSLFVNGVPIDFLLE